MKPWLKYGLLLVGVAALLGLCAPSLTALLFAGISRIQYNSKIPDQIGRLTVPRESITLILWSKPRPRAFSAEGDDRVLQVSQLDRAEEYYPLPAVLPGDTRKISVEWFPAERCLKLVDLGTRDPAGEFIVDLRSRRLLDRTSITRSRDSAVLCYQYRDRSAMPALIFRFSPDRSWAAMFEDETDPRPTGRVIPLGILDRKPGQAPAGK